MMAKLPSEIKVRLVDLDVVTDGFKGIIERLEKLEARFTKTEKPDGPCGDGHDFHMEWRIQHLGIGDLVCRKCGGRKRA